MRVDELLDVLRRINKQQAELVDMKLVEQLMALVVKHPLDEDRAQCQEQIGELVTQRVRSARK